MLITTLVNAVSTQNASGANTNSTKTSFSATTTAYAISVSLLGSAQTGNVQKPVVVYFYESPFSISAGAAAYTINSPHRLECTPRQQANSTSITQSVAIAAMGTYLYCWVEMPSITTAGGTLTVNLIELN